MVNNLKTILENHLQIENEIKKSRFISEIFFVEDTNSADEILINLHNEHPKANHITFAYRIGTERFFDKKSDDGEPSGTAGSPILNVIDKNNLTNILIVVIRYFGGTLLGAGGLTRAYSNGAIDIVNLSTVVDLIEYSIFEFKTEYSNADKIKYFLEQNNVSIINEEYGTLISIKIKLPTSSVNSFINDFNILNNSKYQLNEISKYFSR